MHVLYCIVLYCIVHTYIHTCVSVLVVTWRRVAEGSRCLKKHVEFQNYPTRNMRRTSRTYWVHMLDSNRSVKRTRVGNLLYSKMCISSIEKCKQINNPIKRLLVAIRRVRPRLIKHSQKLFRYNTWWTRERTIVLTSGPDGQDRHFGTEKSKHTIVSQDRIIPAPTLALHVQKPCSLFSPCRLLKFEITHSSS